MAPMATAFSPITPRDCQGKPTLPQPRTKVQESHAGSIIVVYMLRREEDEGWF